MVIASSRVNSLQAAHQIGSLVVLPIVLLLIVQISGTMLFSPLLVTMMGGLLWLVAGVVLYAGSGSLKRQALAARI
jgi:ABC-2 type transport system permease protein